MGRRGLALGGRPLGKTAAPGRGMGAAPLCLSRRATCLGQGRLALMGIRVNRSVLMAGCRQAPLGAQNPTLGEFHREAGVLML